MFDLRQLNQTVDVVELEHFLVTRRSLVPAVAPVVGFAVHLKTVIPADNNWTRFERTETCDFQGGTKRRTETWWNSVC